MESIFSSLRVIDAASFIAGPCAATILADYGADVIKIEPFAGDRLRSVAAGHPSEWSWQLTNRNKRGLSLDITADAGRQVLYRMLEQADVFIVNFGPDQIEKYDLGWEKLKAINPKLIFAQVNGYGLDGAEADRKAFDLTGWFARTGIMDMMREKDAAPTIPAGGVGDHATAMTLYAGIVTALVNREKTGEGSMVSTSLAACGAWANGLNLQSAIAGVDGAERRDREGWSNPLNTVYQSGDGRYFMLCVQNAHRDFPRLLEVLEKTEWLQDDDMWPVKVLFRNRFAVRQRLDEAFGNQKHAGVG